MTNVMSPGRGSRSSLGQRVRADFPILEQSFDGNPLVYLDNAATTQKPRAVLDALVGYYARANSNVGRGYHRLAFAATDAYEESRAVVQRAINAEHPDEVVFVPGTTAAMNMLADTFGRATVSEGDQVVVTGMEHNSNLLPWRRLCEATGAELVVVQTDEQGALNPSRFADAMGPRVRLAAVTHVSNVLGTVNPVRELIDTAHRWEVPVVVDGAQAIPHRQVDVRDLNADFYCFSGHKVYGPMSTGVLYGKRDLLTDLPPWQVGGGTVKDVRADEPVRYVPAPARLEAGTPNVAGAVGLAAAFDYLTEIGWSDIRRHDETLVRAAVEEVGDVPGVRVLGNPAADPSGIVSLVVDGIHPYDVCGHLDHNGIAIRAGVHCANTFVDTLDPVGTVRLSFAVYNTVEELELVSRALRTVEPGLWTTEHPTERFL
ncbi:aminotransferase class V-fold PLP-dependent enzyme [Saccharomonospora iraqiensis]|uniref:aminotransferase class V-fold PLP-dependent enzyme n=1 Tax=Saccharomonospora iraqiensis TaxID=52698 RepID=UPI00022DE920|nr:cysteine desulfurase [Saccharomonospora iraqiensis]